MTAPDETSSLHAFLSFLQKEYSENTTDHEMYISATLVEGVKRVEVVLIDDPDVLILWAPKDRVHVTKLLRFDVPEHATEFLTLNRRKLDERGLYNPEIRSVRGLLDDHMVKTQAALEALHPMMMLAVKHGCG